MKIVRLFLLLLVVGALFVPAVSAYEETFSIFIDTSGKSTISSSGGNEKSENYASLKFLDIQKAQNVNFIALDFTGNVGGRAPGTYTLEYTLDGHTNDCILRVSQTKNILGVVTSTKYLLFPQNWNIGSLTGTKYISFSPFLLNAPGRYSMAPGPTETEIGDGDIFIRLGESEPINKYYYRVAPTYTVTVVSYKDFKNRISIEDYGDSAYQLILTRNLDGKAYASNLNVMGINSALLYTSYDSIDVETYFLKRDISAVNITTNEGDIFNIPSYVFDINTPHTPEDSSTLNLYVRSSQTNALIADARVVIEAGYNDPAELLVVSNTTLPSGTKTYTLQPNGGGLPNPDFYRVTVTADGYNAEMPYADITLDAGVSMTMVMGMQPTGGAPEDPGDTYIDVYVRDIYANPIADATVKMGVYTLKTNAAGYTLFDVPVNSTYAYTVKKTGYTTIEGSVTVANAARYTVNVVLGTGVIPTNTPTAEPTGPGATPTVPAGEETPGPGFIDQSAKNFATFLGVSYAVGRAALGMLIATAIGFTTARKLKGGASEFGIGFIAGAALMVLITLLPAWIFIVMVIIVGGLLGYKYMSGGS